MFFLAFRVQGLGFSVLFFWLLGFRVQGVGFSFFCCMCVSFAITTPPPPPPIHQTQKVPNLKPCPNNLEVLSTAL